MTNRLTVFGLAFASLFVALLALGFSATGTALAGVPASQPNAPAAYPTITTENLPPGAVVETVLSGMVNPIAIAFDPDGRMFYTEKTTGNVRLFANGVLQPAPVINFTVTSSGE